MIGASSFWRRMAQRTAERLSGLAAHGIAFTTALVVIHIAGEAPEFAAIVIAGGLVALAIYKRPATTIRQHFEVQDLTMEGARVDLDQVLALRVLDQLAQAARNIPERTDAEGGR